MSALVLTLVLLAALAHASWNAMLKGRKGDPLAASTGLCVVWALVGWPLTLVVPAPAPESWPWLGASVAVHLAYFALLVAAYGRGDLSFVYTIARGVPPMLVAGGAWLAAGERPSPAGLAGVALVAGGVLTIGGGPKTPGARRPLGLALATAVFIAGYTLLDGLGARASAAPVGYLVWLVALQGTLFAAGALAWRRGPLAREVWARRGVGVLTGVLSAGGYAVAVWAMTRAPIALVAALRETSVLFAAAIGAIWLREPFGRRRLVAAALVAGGVALVRSG